MSLKCLVIDDEPELRSLVKEIVAEYGFECEEAENGDEALEKGLNNPFDLMLVDVKMPGKDGFKVVKEMRDKDVKAKIVYLTGFADVKKALETGADGMLSKPIDDDNMEAMMEKFFNLKRKAA